MFQPIQTGERFFNRLGNFGLNFFRAGTGIDRDNGNHGPIHLRQKIDAHLIISKNAERRERGKDHRNKCRALDRDFGEGHSNPLSGSKALLSLKSLVMLLLHGSQKLVFNVDSCAVAEALMARDHKASARSEAVFNLHMITLLQAELHCNTLRHTVFFDKNI